MANPFLVSVSAHHALAYALDHLRTLRAVLRAEELPMAAGFTLVRGTLENAATAVWLLGPDDRPTRVLRRLQLQGVDLADATTVDALGFPMSGDPERFRTQIAAVAARAGVPRDAALGKAKSVSGIVREAGEALPKGGAHAEGTWRLCSGMSHGRPWALASTLDRQDVREVALGVMEVEMKAPLQSVTAVTMTASAMLDLGMSLHSRHRKRWVTTGATKPGS